MTLSVPHPGGRSGVLVVDVDGRPAFHSSGRVKDGDAGRTTRQRPGASHLEAEHGLEADQDHGEILLAARLKTRAKN